MSILQEHIDIDTLELAGFTKAKPNRAWGLIESWSKVIIGYTFEVNIYESSFFVTMSWRDVVSHSRMAHTPGPAKFETIRKTILQMTEDCIDITKQY